MRTSKPKANWVDVETDGVEARIVMDEHSNGANEYYQAFWTPALDEILAKPADMSEREATLLIDRYISNNYSAIEEEFYNE